MKKLFYAMILCLGLTGFVACSVDTDSEASVTLQYVGNCDSVVFVHAQDSVFEKYIRNTIASKAIPLVGNNSMFTESFTTQDEYMQNAIFNCNQKALKTYETMVNNVSSKVLLSTMKEQNDTIDFSSLGYYTIYYSLYSFIDMQDVKVVTTHKDY